MSRAEQIREGCNRVNVNSGKYDSSSSAEIQNPPPRAPIASPYCSPSPAFSPPFSPPSPAFSPPPPFSPFSPLPPSHPPSSSSPFLHGGAHSGYVSSGIIPAHSASSFSPPPSFPPPSSPPPPSNSPTGPSPEMIRKKLEKVMKHRETFLKSAKASFKQFDENGSGTLDIEEIKSLIARLCVNLQLPPVDSATLYTIFEKYDTEGKGNMSLENFCHMYWQLLLRIKDKYYPTKKMRVRRSVFVGRRNLKDCAIEKLFKFVKKLGSGAFGDVHLVLEISSNMSRVMKIINKDRSAVPLEQIEAEVEVLKSLDHPNIIKIFEVYEDYNNMYIIMETCEGGELLERIVAAQQRGRALSERYVSELMTQLLNALAYFHSKNVAHKDLKPENILFQDRSPDSPIKVIDFGLAELFEKNDSHSKNAAGTALYMAPEVFRRDFTMKCDVWSAGVIMYFLLTGQLPFYGKTIEEVRQKVCHSQPNTKRDCQHLSPAAVDLMAKMMEKKPENRPSATEVLKHVWFTQAVKLDMEISPIICDNMKKYMKQSHLKNALVNLMAHQLNVTGSQIRQINKMFRTLDTNGDGTLSHEELAEGLARVGVPQWDINRIIQSIDIDDSGNVSYTEFLAACYTWRESELNVVWTAFNKMDKDGDGRISTDEFYDIIAGGDSKLIPKSELSDMVKQIDVNGDGIIEWDEFLQYMRAQ